MNDVLKQRLVGALVIIALAVVLWPLVFVAPEREPLDRDSQVPSMPSLAEREIQQPQPLQGLQPPPPEQEIVLHDAPPGAIDDPPQAVAEVELAPAPAPQSEPESAVALPPEAAAVEDTVLPPAAADQVAAEPALSPDGSASVEQPAPALDEAGIPIAWSLQVISVGKKEKAEALLQELVAMDYKAYMKLRRRGEQTLYSLYVGPKFERASIEAAKPVIDDKYRVDSIVVRYVP